MTALERLFTYGSLRTGSGHPMHAAVAAACSLDGPGSVRGLLVAVDEERYPGLVDAEPASQVRGEVWTVHDPSLWARLDAYEGGEYLRIRRPVVLGDALIEAWVYVFVAPWQGLPTIPSGDWLAHLGITPP